MLTLNAVGILILQILSIKSQQQQKFAHKLICKRRIFVTVFKERNGAGMNKKIIQVF